MNRLLMAGVDYKHSPIEIREKVSFTYSSIEKAYHQMKKDGSLEEVMILSTCNRSELYMVVKDTEEGIHYAEHFFARFFSIPYTDLKTHLHFKKGKEVVQHIFEVASGFQSMILGEDQILGQVKDAYERALEYKSSGRILNRLFLDSITTAKKIKTHTGISENALSVSSIGVKLIEEQLKNLQGKKALIIGLGKMSILAIQHLMDKGIEKVYVTNRTRRKTVDFAAIYPEVEGIEFKDRYEPMGQVDIIISCTGAPHFVLHKEKLLQYYKNQPLCILDLAVPRDVEPSVQEIQGVALYQLDDLEKISLQNAEKRMQSMEEGKKIMEEDIQEYTAWLSESKMFGTMAKMQQYSKEIVEKELRVLKQQLGEVSEEDMDAIERAFYRAAKNFIHLPNLRLKEQGKGCHAYMLKKLFALKGEES